MYISRNGFAMTSLLSTILFSILTLLKTDSALALENMVLRQQLQIMKRQSQKRKFRIPKLDKIFFVILNVALGINKNDIIIFTPATLLIWQRTLIKSFWTFFTPRSSPGRPPVPAETKKLILEMKNDNLFWGAKRIRDELLKLGIDLHKSTVQRILKDFRRKGKIKKSVSWTKFLKNQIDSLYATDYFTVDTILNKRYYVLFIIAHKTREIAYTAITENPSEIFLKQQFIEFEEILEGKHIYLIHDRGSDFMTLKYKSYGITNVVTSVEAPNMNAIAERFVRSIRNEALDQFIIFGKGQIENIVKDYVEYYNSMRPHQGIASIPRGEPPHIEKSDFSTGNIRKKPILGGRHHIKYREAS